MYQRGDFHMHTTASDGNLTVKELLNLVKNSNIDVVSITDHDTLASIEEGMNLGKKLGIKIIPGIELSTKFNKEDIHVLGYFKDNSYKDSEFKEFLRDIVDYRAYRAKKIVQNLELYFNIRLNFESILLSSKGVVGRPHIAKAIIDAGYDYDFEFIFNNIINEESPAYVPKKDLSLEDGIELLKSVNALAVLAHPVLLKKNSIESLMAFDFDGIEAIYSLNSIEQTDNFINIAKKYNKLITAGSDFHGFIENDTKHGQIDSVTLQGEALKEFISHIEA